MEVFNEMPKLRPKRSDRIVDTCEKQFKTLPPFTVTNDNSPRTGLRLTPFHQLACNLTCNLPRGGLVGQLRSFWILDIPIVGLEVEEVDRHCLTSVLIVHQCRMQPQAQKRTLSSSCLTLGMTNSL